MRATRRAVRRRGLAAVLAAATLGGCGDEDTGAQAPARGAFLQQANAICDRMAGETRELAAARFDGLDEPPSAARRRAYDREVVALQRARLAELRALSPPPGDEARVGAILDALEQGLDELAARPVEDAGTVGGAPGIARFERLARDYGLDRCAGAS